MRTAPAGVIVMGAAGVAVTTAGLALLRWLLSPAAPDATPPSAEDREVRDLRIESLHRDLRTLVGATSVGAASVTGAMVWWCARSNHRATPGVDPGGAGIHRPRGCPARDARQD